VPAGKRWAYWQWLLARQATKGRKSVVAGGASEVIQSDFDTQVERGRSDESLAEARSVIAVDLPRLFDVERGRASALFSEVSSGPGDNDEGQLEQRVAAVERILLAVAAECPSVGYCQGLDVVAAFTLSVAQEHNMATAANTEAETFRFISALLQSDDTRSWLEPPLIGLRSAAGALGAFFRVRCPELSAHLSREGAGIDLLSLSWLQTFFTGLSPLPRSTLCRIWECWLLDGSPKILLRVALALLARAEGTLLGVPIEQVSETLKTFPPPLDANLECAQLIPDAWGMKITNKKLRLALKNAAQEQARRNTTQSQNSILEDVELEEASPNVPQIVDKKAPESPIEVLDDDSE